MTLRKNRSPAEDSKAQALSAKRRLQLAREAYRKKLGIATTERERWVRPLPPGTPPTIAKPE